MQRAKILKKRLRAYSILEIVISLAIISFASGALLSSLIYGFRVNVNSIARSFVREEIANLTSLIAKDIRNADQVVSCAGEFVKGMNIDDPSIGGCQYKNGAQIYMWKVCTDNDTTFSLCRYRVSASNVNVDTVYQSSQNLNISRLVFQSITSANSKDGIIWVTIIGEHANENLNITNMFSQVSASTRNYRL